MSVKTRQQSRNLAVQTLLAIAILIFLNLISGSFFTRFDLTKEQRYSVSEVSTKIFGELKTPATINGSRIKLDKNISSSHH